MNILILGGAGFLGANLTRRCLREPNVKITVLDSLDPKFHSQRSVLHDVWSEIEFIRGDIRDERLLAELVVDKDIIFNVAGQSSHTLSMQEVMLDTEINCLGSLKLLEAVRVMNPDAVVVYASSSTVIGQARESIIDENHPEKPRDIYSANKGVAEKYYGIYHQVYDLNTVVLRFANLYGPYGKFDPAFGFINHFIHLALRDEEIKVFGAGDQTRNVLYVEDASEVLWIAANHPKMVGENVFATSPYHLSVREIAETIVKIMEQGLVKHISWPETRKRIEVGAHMFSSEKLRALTGWQAKYDFEAGIQRTKEELLRQKLVSTL